MLAQVGSIPAAGFHARCVDFIRYKFRCAAGRLKSAARLTCGTKVPRYEYNTMTDTINNDGQAIVACDSKKLKFSELMQLMLKGEIEMDKPGILFVADEEACFSWYEDEGADKHVTTILRLSARAISKLVRGVFNLNPDAWGTVGEWAAKNMQERAERKAMEKALEIENA